MNGCVNQTGCKLEYPVTTCQQSHNYFTIDVENVSRWTLKAKRDFLKKRCAHKVVTLHMEKSPNLSIGQLSIAAANLKREFPAKSKYQPQLELFLDGITFTDIRSFLSALYKD